MAKKSVKDLIYIVDDEKNVREMVSTTLNDAEFESKCFEDGLQLLDGLKDELPDLIILDWMISVWELMD